MKYVERMMIRIWLLAMHGLSLFLAIQAGSVAEAATRIVPDDYLVIQAAIDAAEDGDTVLVRDGLYQGSLNRDLKIVDKRIALMSENGPSNCIIDCGSLNRGILVKNKGSDSTVIEGFTIINGHLNATYDGNGCGIMCLDASPIIRHCVIENCWTENNGGGIGIEESNALVFECIIMNNSVPFDGGGVHICGGNPVFCHCAIQFNHAGKDGGGILSACQYNEKGTVLFNCLIVSNIASRYGGGIKSQSNGSATCQNCTISDNQAISGAGIYLAEMSRFYMCDSIVWLNEPDTLTKDSTSSHYLSFSDISGTYPGTGIIDSDPLFCLGPSGSYYLSNMQCGQSAYSPCLNTGSAPAKFVCHELPWSLRCISEVTTRTDEQPDMLQADMGYHYILETPPNPTPTPLCTAGVTLDMPFHLYSPGDILFLDAIVCNPDSDALTDHALLIALEADGAFWFAPAWTSYEEGLSFFRLTISAGENRIPIIKPFVWPEIPGSDDFIYFWGALLSPDLSSVVGTIDQWAFGWNDN
ncbi:hypothetical protein JXA80_00910 [bacterium]|nr:hypothetical protein [candidate division CSSED10-310 bacterium]